MTGVAGIELIEVGSDIIAEVLRYKVGITLELLVRMN